MEGSIFFVKKTVLGITGELKWRESGKVKNLPPEPGKYDTPGVVLIITLIFNFKKTHRESADSSVYEPGACIPGLPLKERWKKYKFFAT